MLEIKCHNRNENGSLKKKLERNVALKRKYTKNYDCIL